MVLSTYFLALPCLCAQSSYQAITSRRIAQKISEKAVIKFTKNKVGKFRCELFEKNEVDWIFVCKDFNRVPGLSQLWVVVINKKTGHVEVIPGI